MPWEHSRFNASIIEKWENTAEIQMLWNELLVADDFGEMWNIAGLSKFQSLNNHFSRCCCSSSDDTTIDGTASACNCDETVRTTALYLSTVLHIVEDTITTMMTSSDFSADYSALRVYGGLCFVGVLLVRLKSPPVFFF